MPLAAFAAAWSGPPPPMRWLLHHSFCGSTLLARSVTVPGRALCLSEPQVLTDLAEWRVRLDPIDRPLFAGALLATLAKLSQRWHADEIVLCKPSNWINPAIADFWVPSRGDRVVIAEIEARDFLIAAIRGGRERLTFLLRLYERFAAAWPALAQSTRAAVPPAGDPLNEAVGLVAAVHWMQTVVLEARASGTVQPSIRLKFPHFLHDRLAATAAVDAALDLRLPANLREAATVNAFARHSKQRDQPAPSGEEATNRTIAKLHAKTIARAMVYQERLVDVGADAAAEVKASVARDGE